jgi:hypothetical protein
MSTPLEVSTAALQQARTSLSNAEAKREQFMDGTYSLPAGITFQDLKEEVARCTTVLQGAQKNYDNTLASNRGDLVD